MSENVVPDIRPQLSDAAFKIELALDRENRTEVIEKFQEAIFTLRLARAMAHRIACYTAGDGEDRKRFLEEWEMDVEQVKNSRKFCKFGDEAHGFRVVSQKLTELNVANDQWERVFGEDSLPSEPDYLPVVPGSMHVLPTGTIAYLFDPGPPLSMPRRGRRGRAEPKFSAESYKVCKTALQALQTLIKEMEKTHNDKPLEL